MLPREVLADLERSGFALTSGAPRLVGGGSISKTLRVDTRRGPLLLKLAYEGEGDLLEAEADSLAALERAAAVAVPAIVARGNAGAHAYLALEWIDFAGRSANAERQLGRRLAALHRVTADHFGWHRDNYIGRTPQPNAWSADWAEFFRERRLEHQLGIARRNGLGREGASLGARLVERLGRFFEGHAPAPSLLHGDLWGGNWGATPDGTPYLFDPACYFGDREADLAMTKLFGGFGAEFYRAYDEAWPPAAGRDRRVGLYNLYHLLNHFNLFGGSYRSSVVATLRALVGSID